MGVERDRVKIGISAPNEITVIRQELFDKQNQAGGGGQDVPTGYAPIPPLSIISEGSSEPYELDASATQIMRHYELPRQSIY